MVGGSSHTEPEEAPGAQTGYVYTGEFLVHLAMASNIIGSIIAMGLQLCMNMLLV